MHIKVVYSIVSKTSGLNIVDTIQINLIHDSEFACCVKKIIDFVLFELPNVCFVMFLFLFMCVLW